MLMDARKIKILDKLSASGIKTDKQVTSLGFAEIVDITKDQKLMITDMEVILKFQNAIKNRSVFAFLNNVDERKEKKHGEKRDRKERAPRSDGDRNGSESGGAGLPAAEGFHRIDA